MLKINLSPVRSDEAQSQVSYIAPILNVDGVDYDLSGLNVTHYEGLDYYTIDGYEGLYSISKCGSVLAHSKVREMPNGGLRTYPEKVLKTFKHLGYPRVSLTKDGKTKIYFVHRLVCLRFLENPHNKPDVNHKDGDKQNSHVSNLEWCTSSENRIHALEVLKVVAKGADTTGSKNPRARLTEEAVLTIRKLFNGGLTRTELAEQFSTPLSTIQKIILRDTWSHI